MGFAQVEETRLAFFIKRSSTHSEVRIKVVHGVQSKEQSNKAIGQTYPDVNRPIDHMIGS